MRRFRFLLVTLVLSAQALYYAQAGAPPVARGVVVTTQEGTAKSGTLVATDDGGVLTFSITTPPAKGALVIDDAATGAFTYTPNAGAIGYDTFTFAVSDGTGSSTATGSVFIVAASPQWPGQTVRASIAPDGGQLNPSITLGTTSSADGRFIAFSSGTIDETAGDFDVHVFVHDRQTGQTTIGSKANGSEQSIGGIFPSITPDGRFLAFLTLAVRVPGGNPDAFLDAFVHDRQTGETTRVSVASDGTPGNGDSGFPVLSADGRYAAFNSTSTNFVAADTEDDNDVYLRDRVTGQTTLVSVSSAGVKGNHGSWLPTMSADGRYIAFWSEASNLVAGDTNGQIDLFVRDLWTGQTTRASVGSGGVQLNAHAGGMLSADGRFVVFSSAASNAVPGDTNGASDVFVHDRQTGLTTRVSVTNTGAQSNGDSEGAPMSADGRFVVFRSAASNLVPGDTNGLIDEFVHDRMTGQTVRVNVASDGTQANDVSLGDPDDGCCVMPFISADGRSVVITSLASNLVAGDTNGVDDVFVVGPVLVNPTVVNIPASGGARSVDVSFDYPGTPWTATTTTPWITLTPPSGGSADGTVSFTVAPNTGASRTGTIVAALQTITINQGPPTIPVAQNSSISTPEDISIASTLVASDADGDPITFSIVTPPALGAVTITNPSTGAFVYSPNANFNGTDIFTFRASDGTTFSNTGIVSVTISPVNDAPVANGVELAATEDVSSIGTLVATDVDGDPLTFSIDTPPSHGAVTINATTGAYFYMPAANFTGSDSFTYRAADASLTSNIATVLIQVAPAGPPAPASFHTIGDLPGGPVISAVRDATRVGGVTYAVGASAANTQIECVGPNNPAGCVPQFNTDTPVLWTWDGSAALLTPLPSLVTPAPIAPNGVTASAMTPDASYIASAARSNAANPAQALAVRVTRNGLINLNISAPPFPPLSSPASAQAISADGSILYGTAGNTPRAGRVDVNASSNTVIPLLLPAHTGNVVAGRGTSFDGSVMVGTSFTAPFTGTNGRAFRYVHASPVGGVSAIPLLAGGTWNKALAVSPDGRMTLVGGNSTFLPNGEVYLYDAITGTTTPLGSPNTPWTPANLGGMTADGSVVVATFVDGANSDGSRHAYVHNAHGWFHLTTILAAAGIELAAQGWTAPGMQVNGISPDGTLVFGSIRRDVDDTVEGFVAELPPGYLKSFDVPAVPQTDTAIVGVWTGTGGSGEDVGVFLADGTFFLIDIGRGTQPAGEFTSGFERGRYHWDASTGAFSFATLQDTNGSVGLSGGNGLGGATVTVSGNTLVLGGEIVLTRVTGAAGSIVGGWVFGDPRAENSSGVLVLFADGKFVFVEDGNSTLDPFGRDGVEAGTYSWGANGSFTATVTLDTNGEWGFGNGPGTGGTTTLQLSPDSLRLGEPGDPNQLTRIEDPQAVVPVITSPLVASGVVGSPFSYAITATHALTFGATGLPNSLSINAATGLISGTPTAAGSSTVTISAFNSANSTTTASLTITVVAPTGLTVANASGSFGVSTTLTATLMSMGTPLAGQQVSFSLNGAPAGTATTNGSGVALLPGVSLAGIGAGTYPTGVQASFAGDATHAAASGAAMLTIAKAIPAITWPAPAAITHGTPLSATQLNTTASVPGTFAYTPPSGTVLPVGAGQTLSVMFTPTDGANFATVQAQVTITVLNAAPVARGVVVTTQAGVTKSGTLVATDAEGDALTFSIITSPTKGTLTLVDAATGAFTYTPNPGTIGYDSFTFRAAEGGGASSTATGAVFIVAASPQWPGQTVRASLTPNGSELTTPSTWGSAASADGRFIAFSSGTVNEVTVEIEAHVYVYDRQTGQTTLASKATGSEQSIGGLLPSITPDGRYVGFMTLTSGVPGGDPNAVIDAFVHDRQTGETTRISVASDGTPGNGESGNPVLSADGRYVAFYSRSTNFTAADADDDEDVYLRDRVTGQTTLVSVSSTGVKGNSNSWQPTMSADGRYIAFPSEATNLVPGDTNGQIDLFVRDVWTGQTTRASVGSGGVQLNARAMGILSADGRFVGFHSAASNAVPGDTNGVSDVFVHDRQTGLTTRVSVTTTGAQSNGDSVDATMSADGRVVVFRSAAANLVPGDTNGLVDEFVHDRVTGQTVRVNVASDGTQANNFSTGDPDDGCCILPFISADGRSVVITSLASNLVAGDTNNTDDVFVVGPVLVSPTTISVSGSAGTHSINVAADYQGPWTTTTTTPWITLDPPVGGSGSGTVSFTVAANPGAARTGTIVVALQTVTVNQGPSTAPVAQNGSFTTTEDTPFSGTLVATDPNGDALTFSIVTPPLRGNVIITNSATGAFTYTPALNAFGGVSFTFQVSAAGEASNVATVIIDLSPVNDAPSAFDSTLAATEDTPASSFFSTADGDSLFTTVELVTPPAHGTVTIPNPTGGALGGVLYTYTPSPNYNGPDSFTFRAGEAGLFSNVATVSITVAPVNDAPVASSMVVTAPEGGVQPGLLQAADIDGDTLTFTIVTPPTKGSLTITDAAAGAFTFTPNSGASGYDTFAFRAADSSGASSSATAMVFIVTSSPRWPGGLVRASVASNGAQANAESFSVAVSADGRYTAFESNASNLVAGDTNDMADVFVRDRNTGVVTRVSVGSGGVQANSISGSPALSADGRYVAFISSASNLAAGDSNGVDDVFVRDLQSGQTTRVGPIVDPTATSWIVVTPALSADGRYVAFVSVASNVVAGDTNGLYDVFVHDRQTGQTARVSVASSGTPANQSSFAVKLSGDGRYVAFTTTASNLVSGDTNGQDDVFVHDRQTRQTTRASVSTAGTQANGFNREPEISADGRYVAFYSSASNLVAGDTNALSDVFVRDLQAGQTMRMSVASDGAQANQSSFVLALSADARYVLFESGASNLVPGDTNARSDLFVRDRQTGATTRVSLTDDGGQPGFGANFTVMSADGRFIGFVSFSASLVPSDTNGATDVFVFGGVSVTPTAVNLPASGGSRSVNVAFVYPGTWTASTATPWITINPPAGGSANGTVSFTVSPNAGAARTGTLVVASQTVTVTQDAATAPVAQSSSATETREDTSVTGNLVATDPNGDPITFSLVGLPTHGTVVLNDPATGSFTYTPAPNFHGTDSFTFRATAGGEMSNIAVIAIPVTPVNDVPLATGGSLAVVEDGSATGTLTAVDVDGDVQTFTVLTPPAHGIVTISDTMTGAYTYWPAANYNGADSFTFRAFDGGTLSNIATVTVSVAALEDVPNASSMVLATPEGVAVNGTLSGTDGDGDAVTLTVLTSPTRGTLTVTDPAPGTFTYTPNPGAVGYDSFTFSASNATGSSTGTASIIIVANSPRWPGQTVRVGTLPVGNSQFTTISADGRYIALGSSSSTLVTGDTNGQADVFVYDRQTAVTTRVSVATDGTQGNGFSVDPSLSADGRYVAFRSTASNLVAGDTNGMTDIFVHDRQTGVTTRVSVASDGMQSNGLSQEVAISTDGRYVTFKSSASSLVPADTNDVTDVFVHDRLTGVTTRESVAGNGLQGFKSSERPALSGDGRYVAFYSAEGFVAADTNALSDVFVRDRQTGVTTRVSVATGGGQGNSNSSVPSLSVDGRYVAFGSDASNLVAGDTNGVSDVFVHDRQTGVTSRVSVADDGTQGNGISGGPMLSADGRFVAFMSFASNLVASDTNGQVDVFVHDRQTGHTRRLSVASNGTQGNGLSYQAALSADGRHVAFSSVASNLVAGDTNAVEDIFVVGGVKVSPTTIGVPADGGTRSFDVSFDYPGTPWTAATATPWIGLLPPSGGSINGTVTFDAAPNFGPARTGTIVAALQTITVTQDAFADVTPPTVTPPPAIAVYATVSGGATPATLPALAAFLAGATAVDDAPAAPVQQTPQLNGAAITDTTVFASGLNSVTFSFRDAAGNIGTATSVVAVIGGGRPSLAVAIVGTIAAAGQQNATLRVTNNGAGNSLNVNIALSSVIRTLAGTGTVTLVSGLPASIPLLSPGQSSEIPIVLNVPSTVRRFALSEIVTMTDHMGASLTTTASQTVFPTDVTGPTITTGPLMTVTSTSMTVTWQTNEPATSRVDWGVGSSVNRFVPEDAVYKTSHTVTITGMLPNTLYSIVVSGHDQAGNSYNSIRTTRRTNP